ncbi:hypothetical protein, partial [Pseudomonas sp. EL_65y_Pfl2_R96]|uniref:hypothetical protein n=1 Tax=Pseudomonas sp. EL_65y_Pfl2_R96 TaxID=3088699 RepID=UPI0030D74B2C
ARLGTQGAQAGDAVGDGWINFRAKTMRYFLFDKSCRRLRSFDFGGLTADQALPDDANLLWERACSRRRPYSQRCLLLGKNIRTFPHVFQVARRKLRL